VRPRRAQRWLTAGLTLAVVGITASAEAYEVDFHYYVIYLLLRSRGYQALEADALAGFSQYVDDNGKTEPLKCTFSRRAAFHFAGSDSRTATAADFGAARDAVTRGFTTYASGAAAGKYIVGAALHLLADTFSHAGFTAWWNRSLNCRAGSRRPCIGHADTNEDGHAPDRPYNASTAALGAARAIYDLIPLSSGGPSVSWASLEPDLARAFDDYSPTIEGRITKLRRVLDKHFHESVDYTWTKFHREKLAYQAAVLP
jgi:hypothetical protein